MSARVVIDRDPLDLHGAHELAGKKHERGEQSYKSDPSSVTVSLPFHGHFRKGKLCKSQKNATWECKMIYVIQAFKTLKVSLFINIASCQQYLRPFLTSVSLFQSPFG